MANVCPVCRAQVPETSIVCEYCGTSIQSLSAVALTTDPGGKAVVLGELGNVVREANDHIAKLKRLVQPSYKYIGVEEKMVDKAEESCRNLSVFAGENKKVIEIIDEMTELITNANIRIRAAHQSRKAKAIVLTTGYFVAVLFVLGAIIALGHFIDPKSLETWFVGSLALIALILGGMMGGLLGAIGAAIIGGLIGMLMQWFIASIAGNVIFGIAWVAGFTILYFAAIKDSIT